MVLGQSIRCNGAMDSVKAKDRYKSAARQYTALTAGLLSGPRDIVKTFAILRLSSYGRFAGIQ